MIRPALTAVLGAVAVAFAAAPAQAAPPPNDAPQAAAEFAAVTAENGTPDERQGVAELAEATPDPNVARCLGPASFMRTVWFRVPATDAPREIRVEGTGRTTDLLDLAAFVQPAGATGPVTTEPNACAGGGVGGADAGGEPASGLALRVPGGRSVLVQVGRRGPVGSAEDEQAVLSLATVDLAARPGPAGDVADAASPGLAEGPAQTVALGGATITEEDPAQPPCPSLGSVWRRYVPSFSGPATIVAGGGQSATLALFSGTVGADTVLSCVDRERSSGTLALDVSVQAGQPIWVRVGTDRPPGEATGTLAVLRGFQAAQRNTGGGPPIAAGSGAGASCVEGSGFRSVATRPSRGRLGLAFTRAVARPVDIDVFQQSVGRRVVGERLIARFTSLTRSLTWNGKANRRGRRVADGYYFVRYRIAQPGGGVDVRRLTLRRVRGRFTARPAFFRRATCDLVRSYKLTRPVFGGRSNRAISASYRLTGPARVTLEVLRGTRVVRRLALRRSVRGGQTYRASFAAAGRAPGDYRFRLTADPASGRTVRATLTSRRL